MSKKYIGNLVQSLSGGSGGGGGGDTGVGKPYPGSTGGEYFNYYGTDANKNIASGDYSTARGYKCEATGNYSFACGQSNKALGDGSTAIGYGNTLQGIGTFAFGDSNSMRKTGIAVGNSNSNNGTNYRGGRIWFFGGGNFLISDYGSSQSTGNNTIIGYQNSITENGSNDYISACTLVGFGNKINRKSAGGAMLCGTALSYPTLSDANVRAIYGVYNNETCSLSSPRAIIGCGDSTTRKNAIEIDSTECKILNNLQLNADTTSVNAITTPQDPNNITTDDQTLATKSYVDANSGSGGVGQAYSGSTGGEIFNYYVTGTFANEASGAYSTARGYNCKAIGNYSLAEGANCRAEGSHSFAGGYLNTTYASYSFIYGSNNQTTLPATNSVNIGGSNTCIGIGSVILGYNNGITQDGTYGITIGSNNTGKNYYGIMIGTDNNSSTFDGARLIGDRLNASAKDQFIFGRCNASPSLTSANFIFGCGTAANNRKNFLEASVNSCKICNNLQLATDTTEVNAITPPQDPNNVTADDKTLVTKSWAGANYTNSVDLNINQSITPSTTSITIPYSSVPSWAKNILLTIRVNGSSTTSVVLLKELTVNHSEFEAMSHYYNTSNSTFSTHWNNFSLTYNDTDSEYTLTWTKSLHYRQDMTTGTLTLVNDTIANSSDTITIMEIKALP